MNIWGKVLAFLVLASALGGTYLTAKLIQVRNSWTKKTQSFAKDYATTAEKNAESDKQIQNIRRELENEVREWGSTAPGIDTRVANPADGSVMAAMGTNQGVRDQQILHAFELQQDGSSIYRGAFRVVEPQADQTGLIPTWRARPDDVGTWKAGRWRWRTNIPAGYVTRFDEQEIAFTKADEVLSDRRLSLAIQERLLGEIKSQRQRRVAELVGGEGLLQDESLPPEFRQGLVATLEETEETRNELLLEIDSLRRRLRTARMAVEQLQQQNTELVKRLPQPTTEVTAKPN